jgi:uncharacterized protein YjbJ (UPF0337 family)
MDLPFLVGSKISSYRGVCRFDDGFPPPDAGNNRTRATKRRLPMGGQKDRTEGRWDEAKGRVKEAAGDLTGDRETEAEGEKDQTKGKAKQAKGDLKDAKDKVRDSINKAFD